LARPADRVDRLGRSGGGEMRRRPVWHGAESRYPTLSV